MTNIEELKEYIKFQTLNTEDDADTMSVFYLRVNDQSPLNINISFEQVTVNLDLTEEEAVKLIDQYLTDFSETVNHDEAAIEQAKNTVRIKSRRGLADKNYKNSWFYAGQQYDQPVLVAEHKGKYAVMKHPLFDNYGFIVE